jgi:transposase
MRTPKSPEEFGFNRYDTQRLKKALHKAADKRAFRRIQAVWLFAQGMDIHTVARIALSSVRVVYKWIRLYLSDHQVLALSDAPRSGRPSVAPQVTAEQILHALKANPLNLGYNTTVWTVDMLTEHLSKCYQCTIRSFTLYRRMKHMGLRCKRPRYVYSEKDPHRTQKKGRLSAG